MKLIEWIMSIILLGSMKLYATVTSERDSRPVKKGGDEMIRIELKRGNKFSFYIYLTNETMVIEKEGKQVYIDK